MPLLAMTYVMIGIVFGTFVGAAPAIDYFQF